MAIDHQGIVSIVELIVYIPASILSVIVAIRLRWTKITPWIYVTALCLLRIIGSVTQLISMNQDTPAHGLVETTLICQFIGLSPLLFATMSLVSRSVYLINSKAGDRIIGRKRFYFVHALISAAAGLCIAGGAGNTRESPGSELKVGIVVYVASFAAVTLLYVMSFRHHTLVPIQERRIYLAIAIAWPLILVRLVYSILAVFSHDQEFSAYSGRVGIRVGMATVEEFVIVAIYLALGLALQSIVEGAQTQPPAREYRKREDWTLAV